MAKLINPLEADYRLSAMENVDDALFVIDLDGLLDYYNAQFKGLIYQQGTVPMGQVYSDLFARIAAVSENPRQTLMQLEVAYTRRQQKTILCLSIVKPTRQEWQLTLFPLLIENHFIGWGGMIQLLSKVSSMPVAMPPPAEDLRSTIKGRTVEASPEQSTFIRGDLSIDFVRRRVRVSGRSVRLTPKESRLLHILALNAGRILTGKYLLLSIWGSSYMEETQILWTNISRLRKKLGDTSANPRYILTDRGGYYIPLDEASSYPA